MGNVKLLFPIRANFDTTTYNWEVSSSVWPSSIQTEHPEEIQRSIWPPPPRANGSVTTKLSLFEPDCYWGVVAAMPYNSDCVPIKINKDDDSVMKMSSTISWKTSAFDWRLFLISWAEKNRTPYKSICAHSINISKEGRRNRSQILFHLLLLLLGDIRILAVIVQYLRQQMSPI